MAGNFPPFSLAPGFGANVSYLAYCCACSGLYSVIRCAELAALYEELEYQLNSLRTAIEDSLLSRAITDT